MKSASTCSLVPRATSIGLPTLVELKLASGLTGGLHRMKDIADVIALIKALSLTREFGQQVNEYVRPKYYELWEGIQGPDPVNDDG